MLSRLMSKVENVLGASSPEAASTGFFNSVRGFGASYLQTRVYRRPVGILTSASHWAAGGFVKRIAPAAWPGSAGFNFICFECNPLLAAIREGRTRYRFSDFAPRGRAAFADYWDALGEARIGDALCSTSYGSGGLIASLHLGFPDDDISPDDGLALQLAGLVLTERLMSLAAPSAEVPVHLTDRERDSIALVAEGKTDWEISVILSVSEATARFHVDNARRKLGAANRAQAVARLVNQRLV